MVPGEGMTSKGHIRTKVDTRIYVYFSYLSLSIGIIFRLSFHVVRDNADDAALDMLIVFFPCS